MSTRTPKPASKTAAPKDNVVLPPVDQLPDAELERLLRELSAELMSRRRFYMVRIEEEDGVLVVSRFKNPVPLKEWPADFSWGLRLSQAA